MSLSFLAVVLLVVLSALLSGSEVAMFSINTEQRKTLKDSTNNNSGRILKLLEEPKKLLATILIANNFVNVSIVMASNYVFNNLFIDGSISETSRFYFELL